MANRSLRNPINLVDEPQESGLIGISDPLRNQFCFNAPGNLILTIILHFMALYGHQLGYCYSIIFHIFPDTSHSDSGSSDKLVNEHRS
jgi:hypothetical protein